MNIILIGFAGSGKGTQASRLSKKLGIPNISVGQILREEVKKGSEIGKYVNQYLLEGQLIPDDVVMQIVEERIGQDDCKSGFIFDGFPRTVRQAELLDVLMAKTKLKIDVVIKIDIDRSSVIKRILGRYSCNNCETIYNEFFAPTKIKGKCDVCGATEFTYRKDDTNEEAVKKRLDIYTERTQPVIDFYQKKGLIYSVNGVKDIESVGQEIDQIIEKKKVN